MPLTERVIVSPVSSIDSGAGPTPWYPRSIVVVRASSGRLIPTAWSNLKDARAIDSVVIPSPSKNEGAEGINTP